MSSWRTVFHPARIGAFIVSIGAIINIEVLGGISDGPGIDVGTLFVLAGSWITGEIGAASRGTRDIIADSHRGIDARNEYDAEPM